MLKYLTKFALDILPSVAATVLGAYIVNHYIANKPAANAPAAAVGSSTLKKAAPKAETKADTKPAEVGAAAGPEVGVNAKGISEKVMTDKTAADAKPAGRKPAEPMSAETQGAETKSGETKSAETKPAELKPAGSASASEPRRHQVVPRDKAMAKSTPLPPAAAVASAPAATAASSPTSAASSVPPSEAAVTAEQHGDAVDLARAAIERLKGMADGKPRAQEAAHVGGPVRVQEPPRTVAVNPVVRPLPPPINVSTPSADPAASAQPVSSQDDPNRPIPPADIPLSPPQPPLDLHADAAPSTARDRSRNVAEDMLSAAKSMFHAVLPNSEKFTED